ncbi:MAG: hypothetical protein IJQ41_06605 [Firmicutes bacterium]|nr:hypothetical protein [Bacillota bacterium]MBQ4409973.1 hypothetical protein [Bacillota bacterium]MBQ6295409.1 hypothetical protein [Bacillota bacterium]MBR0210397.1 hypothetical protein [Bacillota bacterium]MBR0516573.1 hypothetical protein [Bacillota bacterium]
MTNQEMRQIRDRYNVSLFKINYKSGVHYGVIEDFFNGKTDELSDKDREGIVKVLEGEVKRKK